MGRSSSVIRMISRGLCRKLLCMSAQGCGPGTGRERSRGMYHRGSSMIWHRRLSSLLPSHSEMVYQNNDRRQSKSREMESPKEPYRSATMSMHICSLPIPSQFTARTKTPRARTRRIYAERMQCKLPTSPVMKVVSPLHLPHRPTNTDPRQPPQIPQT